MTLEKFERRFPAGQGATRQKGASVSQIEGYRGRGIQPADVFAAADALLAEGQRPTIERVRLKIGRGSPNTVSPLLERWFATLSKRMAGTGPGSSSAGQEATSVPAAVQSAAQLLWDTARREAHAQEQNAQASVRNELQAREEALEEGLSTLTQREAAFAQTRSSLDAALAAAQQVAEGSRQQLRHQTQEAQRVRSDLEGQVVRLNAQLAQAMERHDATRLAHDQVLAAKDQDMRQAEERHAQEHQRMLLEVDRARQATKSVEAELDLERQRRVRAEAEGAQRLAEAQVKIQQLQDDSRATEAELRTQLTAQAAEVALAKSDCTSARHEIEALGSRLSEERRTHDATRALLAQALATDERRRNGQGTELRRGKRGSEPGGSAG
ncbi:MAG: DNA-binding protein [Pseudomonadota bacterium]